MQKCALVEPDPGSGLAATGGTSRHAVGSDEEAVTPWVPSQRSPLTARDPSNLRVAGDTHPGRTRPPFARTGRSALACWARRSGTAPLHLYASQCQPAVAGLLVDRAARICMASLAEAFSRSEVMDLAGPAVYGRGVGYFRQGRVEPQAGGDRRLRATVRGSVPYTVELWVDGGQPGWSCTCPYAEEGSLCKHGVAVALLLDPAGLEADPPATVSTSGEDESGLLVDHVDGLGRER
jgi:hypothetical protein